MNISTELRWILIVCGVVLLLAIYWWGRRSDRRTEPAASFERTRHDPIEPVIDSDEESMSAHDDGFDPSEAIEKVESFHSNPDSADWPEVRLHENTGGETDVHEDISIAADAHETTAAIPATHADQPVSTHISSIPDTEMTPATSHVKAKPAVQRKIVALRLAIDGNGLAGDELLDFLRGAGLQHGKFGIFHRMQAGSSVFSVASMVEPGSFDLATMAQSRYPGLTLFMLLPGPLDGLIAFDQMVSFAQRLAQTSGGALQDERGKPLTAQTLTRLRDEVLDFQHLMGAVPL